MYAVVKTGGKQVKVSEGDILRVEKIDGLTLVVRPQPKRR